MNEDRGSGPLYLLGTRGEPDVPLRRLCRPNAPAAHEPAIVHGGSIGADERINRWFCPDGSDLHVRCHHAYARFDAPVPTLAEAAAGALMGLLERMRDASGVAPQAIAEAAERLHQTERVPATFFVHGFRLPHAPELRSACCRALEKIAWDGRLRLALVVDTDALMRAAERDDVPLHRAYARYQLAPLTTGEIIHRYWPGRESEPAVVALAQRLLAETGGQPTWLSSVLSIARNDHRSLEEEDAPAGLPAAGALKRAFALVSTPDIAQLDRWEERVNAALAGCTGDATGDAFLRLALYTRGHVCASDEVPDADRPWFCLGLVGYRHDGFWGALSDAHRLLMSALFGRFRAKGLVE